MANTKNSTEKILNRVSRIEGQLRGIKRMIEEKKDCINIINQVSAIKEAVAMLGVEIFKDDFICKSRNREKIDDEYIKTLFKIR